MTDDCSAARIEYYERFINDVLKTKLKLVRNFFFFKYFKSHFFLIILVIIFVTFYDFNSYGCVQ